MKEKRWKFSSKLMKGVESFSEIDEKVEKDQVNWWKELKRIKLIDGKSWRYLKGVK